MKNTPMRERYHHGDLRQALIEAALAELDAHGELPSWRALARACAVSQTAPYRHFDSFESLQAAVAAAAFDQLTQSIEQVGAELPDPYARLGAGLRAYVEFGRQHPSWYALMFGNHLVQPLREEVRTAGRAAYATLISAINACGVPQPENVAFTVWSAVHGIADLVGNGISPPDAPSGVADSAVEGVFAMCVSYVKQAAARPITVRSKRARASP